jgi:hypothetical protein
MRVVENSPTRLVIEDTGTGFGVVCVIAGHAIAAMPLAWPPWHLWLLVVELAVGAGVAGYGATLLTRTRTTFDRVNGDIRYERRNFFRAHFARAYFYEVEEVALQRGPREVDRFRADPTQSYSFRPVLRVRGQAWPLGRAYRDHATASAAALAARAVLDAFALGAPATSGARS